MHYKVGETFGTTTAFDSVEVRNCGEQSGESKAVSTSVEIQFYNSHLPPPHKVANGIAHQAFPPALLPGGGNVPIMLIEVNFFINRTNYRNEAT